MNLFEAFALLLIAIGLVAGLVAGVGQGPWGALMGALSGAAKAFALFFVSMLGILLTLALGLAYRPPFPRCASGRCSAADYTYLSLDTADGTCLPNGPRGMLARCKCGTLYLRSAEQRRVWTVLEDGSLVAYMRHLPFGRWRPEGPGSAPAQR